MDLKNKKTATAKRKGLVKAARGTNAISFTKDAIEEYSEYTRSQAKLILEGLAQAADLPFSALYSAKRLEKVCEVLNDSKSGVSQEIRNSSESRIDSSNQIISDIECRLFGAEGEKVSHK